MAKTDYQSIDEYHLAFPEEVRIRLETLRQIVRIKWHRLFRSNQLPNTSLLKSENFLVYYAGFAKHLTLSNPWSQEFLSHFEKDLVGLKVSRAAIQFPLNQPLPKALIERMVRFRKKRLMLKSNSAYIKTKLEKGYTYKILPLK